MPVSPYYIVVVSCPDYMKADELKLELPICGYVAAKHTSLESSRGCCQRRPTGYGAVPTPEFVQDWERVNEK